MVFKKLVEVASSLPNDENAEGCSSLAVEHALPTFWGAKRLCLQLSSYGVLGLCIITAKANKKLVTAALVSK